MTLILSRKHLTVAIITAIASSASINTYANPVDKTVTVTGQLTENTGERLTSLSDNIYTRLTGQSINDVAVNHPVSLYDYKEADSAYEDAYVNGALNVKDSKDADTSYDLTVGIDYEKVVSSPNANTKYEVNANGFFADDGDDDTAKTKNYSANLSANYDRYFQPESNDTFWYAKAESRIQEQDPKGYAGIENPEVTLSGGLGYGRVVNVTPMAQTMRLVEALVKNGNLASAPSSKTYQDVAKVISLKEVYQRQYPDNYAQYWISDIEKALNVTLGASGSIRAYDVLTEEKISTRKHGWDVRAGAGVVAHDFAGNSGNPLLELQGNYYLPISNKTQFSNEARMSAQLDDNEDSYILANRMGLTYELSDRVDWENMWNLSYENNENAPDITRNSLSSAFLYEISNSLDYETRVVLSRVDVEGEDDTFDKGLFMGIKYRMK